MVVTVRVTFAIITKTKRDLTRLLRICRVRGRVGDLTASAYLFKTSSGALCINRESR